MSVDLVMTKLLEEIEKLPLEEQEALLEALRVSVRRESRRRKRAETAKALNELIREIDRGKVRMYTMEEAEELLNSID